MERFYFSSQESPSCISHMTRPALGIDFGGTSIKFGVVVGETIIASPAPIPTQDYSTRESLIDAICTVIRSVREEYPDLMAVGVGVPGFVHFGRGEVANLTNVTGWQNVPLKAILQERTQLPVVVDNDANAMAYAEWKLGAGRGITDLVCLTLGTGVGGGIIANNQMIRGGQGAAGELGQTSIDYRGRVGAYGNPGALEDYIGNREIIQEAIRFYKHQGVTKTAAELTPADLSELATYQDAIALEVWEWVAEKLACTLMNCCYLLNPDAFIIGGGVAKAGDLIYTPLQRYLEKWMMGPHLDHLQLLPAHFGNEAGIIGCAALALDTATTE